MTVIAMNATTKETLLGAAAVADVDLATHAGTISATLNAALAAYPYGWADEEITVEIRSALAASGITASTDQAWKMAPVVAAWLAGEYTAEPWLECCKHQYYSDPGMAYVHRRCGRLLRPFGDVHPHDLCGCYGTPAEPKDGDGGTVTVVEIA